MMRIYTWMESRKDKVKWKQPKPFIREGVLKRSRTRFWAKVGLLVGLLVWLVGLLRKYRGKLGPLVKVLRGYLRI